LPSSLTSSMLARGVVGIAAYCEKFLMNSR